jgi:hypothetical protein
MVYLVILYLRYIDALAPLTTLIEALALDSISSKLLSRTRGCMARLGRDLPYQDQV